MVSRLTTLLVTIYMPYSLSRAFCSTMYSTYTEKRLPTLVIEDLREQHDTLQDEVEAHQNISSWAYDDVELINSKKRKIADIRNILREHLVFVMDRIPIEN